MTSLLLDLTETAVLFNWSIIWIYLIMTWLWISIKGAVAMQRDDWAAVGIKQSLSFWQKIGLTSNTPKKIRQRRRWKNSTAAWQIFDGGGAKRIRRGASAKFDGAGVYYVELSPSILVRGRIGRPTPDTWRRDLILDTYLHELLLLFIFVT